MKLHFGYLLGLSSLAIAGAAAFFSVYGISQLFAGASLAVIIMASALEFSKLVAASYLQRYWKRISKALRVYVVLGVMVLVLITSAGIYGFLSNAYQQTANTYEIHQHEMAILQSKHDGFERKIVSNNSIIKNKNNRSIQLGDLRNNQEIRLDSLLANNHWVNARKTREDINLATTEIQKLTLDVDGLNNSNGILNDSINKYKILMVKKESDTQVTAELGPLKYLSTLTGLSMDRVVNYFILLLIFVFDPLAVALILATNWVFMEEKRKMSEKPPKKKRLVEDTLKEKVVSQVEPDKVDINDIDVVEEEVIINKEFIDDNTHTIDKDLIQEEPKINSEIKPTVIEPIRPIAKQGIVKPATGQTKSNIPTIINHEDIGNNENIIKNFAKPTPIRRDRKGKL